MKPKMEQNIGSLAVIGVDIGKEVFHLVGLGVDGKIAFRRKIRRLGLKDAFEQLPPCIVGMEACLSAHFVSRTLRALGHEPRIIPAIYVKPFVKGQKNDYNDAEAIAEAELHRNGTGRCAQSGASRPALLQHRARQAQMPNRLYPSLDERQGSGQQRRLVFVFLPKLDSVLSPMC
jgi:transposase